MVLFGSCCTFKCEYIDLLLIRFVRGLRDPFAYVCMKRHISIANTTVCAPVFLQDYDDYYEAYDDPKPLNCSTTETIGDGHVTYSQVKKKTKTQHIRAKMIN